MLEGQQMRKTMAITRTTLRHLQRKIPRRNNNPPLPSAAASAETAACATSSASWANYRFDFEVN
jgi:hypothetical protein